MVEITPCKPTRPWRAVAEEASREQDAGRMIQLIEELNRALEEQGFLGPGDHGAERKTA